MMARSVRFMSTPNVLFQINYYKGARDVKDFIKEDDLTNESIHSWVILVAVVLFNIILGYHNMTFTVYYVTFTEAFDTNKATAGFIGSIHSAVTSFFSIFASVLIDLYGAKAIAVAGCLLTVLGVLTSALSPTIYMLYLTYGCLAGCGISISFLASLVIIQQHFKKHRNIATSISVCGLPIGNIVSPIITNKLLDLYGWRGALFIHSGIVLHSVVLALLFTPPKSETTVKRNMSSFCKSLIDFSLMKKMILWPFMFSMLLSRILIVTFMDHTAGRAVFMGSDLTAAGYLITTICVGALLSRLFNSVLMLFVNINPLIILSAVYCAQSLLSFALTFCKSYPAVVVCNFLFGCAQGLVVPILLLVIVKIAGISRFSKARAIAEVFGAVGSLIATPVTGWMFDVTGKYDIPFYFSGLVGLLSAFCVLIVLIIYKVQKIKRPQSEITTTDEEFYLDENIRIRTFTF